MYPIVINSQKNARLFIGKTRLLTICLHLFEFLEEFHFYFSFAQAGRFSICTVLR